MEGHRVVDMYARRRPEDRNLIVAVLALSRCGACQIARLPLELLFALLEAVPQPRNYAAPEATRTIALPPGVYAAGCLAVTADGNLVLSTKDEGRGTEGGLYVIRNDGAILNVFQLTFLPTSVLVDRNGRIVVGDLKRRRMVTLREDGSEEAEVALNPSSVAEDRDGNFVVADPPNGNLHAFARDGHLLWTAGSQGQFDNPHSVAVHHSGAVAFLERGQSFVYVLADRTLRLFRAPTPPVGVAFDEAGNIVTLSLQRGMFMHDEYCVRVMSPRWAPLWEARGPSRVTTSTHFQPPRAAVAVLRDGRIAVACDGFVAIM